MQSWRCIDFTKKTQDNWFQKIKYHQMAASLEIRNIYIRNNINYFLFSLNFNCIFVLDLYISYCKIDFHFACSF